MIPKFRFPDTILCTAVALLLAGLLASCATSVVPASEGRQESLLNTAPDDVEPPSASTLYAMAHVLSLKGFTADAERILLRIIQEYPGYAPAYSAAADLRLQEGRLTEAKDVLRQGIDKTPSEGELHNNLGVCQLLAQDYEAALASFETAQESDPFEKRYQANSALALALMGRTEEAMTRYRGVISQKDAAYNLRIISEMRASMYENDLP